jgi:hypothetical protein
MRSLTAALGFLVITVASAVRTLPAKEKGPRQPVAWCYVQEGPLEVVRSVAGRKTSSLSLSRGALVPVMRSESKNGRTRVMLRITVLETIASLDGWADARQAEILPADRFPSDEDILRQLSLEPPSGFAAPSFAVVRWLVKQGASGAALVCFIASPGLPESRLVAFLPTGGKYVRGPQLEFPFSDMDPGILSAEVRDLIGDGVQCLITREPFRKGPEILGVNLVIRRIQGGDFTTLWTAPLKSRNFGSFPRDIQKLDPPEKNAGAPGTVTNAEVEFQTSGKITIPVWKATIGFFAVGQDKPSDSVEISKACAWDGSKFESIQ